MDWTIQAFVLQSESRVERELNIDEIRRQLHNESVMAQIEDADKS